MSVVMCSNVYVKFINSVKGYGAFAAKDLSKGGLIEKGLMRIVETDGNKNPYVFTWSDDRSVWAYPSGCATFYNTSREPNCKMNRHFKSLSFEMVASKDIKKDEELTHLYKSLEWRPVFQNL